jgi:hypothetical protein
MSQGGGAIVASDMVDSDKNKTTHAAGVPVTTHSFYYVMLILSLAFIALIICLMVTIRDCAFHSPPSSPRSHYVGKKTHMLNLTINLKQCDIV